MSKNILVVDDSAAVQEMCRQVLSEGGHRVSVASNGVAALTFPELDQIDLLIIDTHLRDVSGIDITRQIKTDGELHDKPVLLLIPEEKTTENESVELMGANAWLAKPFDPATLLNKVNTILAEQEITKQAQEHLKRAAERTITRMAEKYIQKAVEEKTQIMVERALQMVISQVDKKARLEVESKVTELITEKEQELVRITVQEVARNTVDKLADKRVSEAMDRILIAETEKTVKRAADELFPSLIRERIHESLELVLPKEVTRRVQKEAEELVPEVSEKVVTIITAATEKIVPKMAREIVKDHSENYVSVELDKHLPRLVHTMVGAEVDGLISQRMEPYLREQAGRLRRRISLFMLLFMALVGGCAALLTADYMFGPLLQRPATAVQTSQPTGDSATPAAAPADESRDTDSQPGNWLMSMRERLGL